MKEIDCNLEGIDPEDFNLEDFQKEVELELRRMSSSSEGERIFTIVKRENIPRPSPISLLLSSIRSYRVTYIFTGAGIIIGFLLARTTSIEFPTIFLTVFISISILLLISKLASIYQERQAKKERKTRQERVRAEELAKQRISQLKAEEVLEKPNIRRSLCPYLLSVTTDAFEISKVVTPVLTGLVLAGTISIPLNPILFAAISLVIAKSGVNGFCADYK